MTEEHRRRTEDTVSWMRKNIFSIIALLVLIAGYLMSWGGIKDKIDCIPSMIKETASVKEDVIVLKTIMPIVQADLGEIKQALGIRRRNR